MGIFTSVLRKVWGEPQTMRFLRAHRATPPAVVVVLWIAAIGGRVVKSGTCFDLNYSVLQPDGNLYIGLARNLLRGSLADSPAVVWTRPLMSLVSVPSYAAFGDMGLLVVPMLSLLAVGLLLLQLGIDCEAPWAGVGVFALLSFSVTVNRWMIADLTDSPHAALLLWCFVLLTRRSKLSLIAIVVALGALTRPAGPLWAGLLLAFAIEAGPGRRRGLIGLGVASLFAFLVAGLSLSATGGFDRDLVSPAERFAALVPHFFSVSFMEIAELAVLDRLLLAFVAIATFLALRNRRNVWSAAYLYVLLTSLGLSAWIGVYGVNFRYQMPAVFIGGALIIRWIGEVNTAWTQSSPRSGVPE